MLQRDDLPVVIFDLDGTVLEVNSFPHWVRFLITGRLPGLGPRRRAMLSLGAMLQVVRRKLLRASHSDFLWCLQRLWQSVCLAQPDVSLTRFEMAMLRRVRPNLAAALELVAAKRIDAILATAAAEDYAASLGRRLGFDDVLATPSGRGRGEPINSSARKRERLLAFLDERGWGERPMILFTDHVDDLPLMRDSRIVYWCGPADALEQAAAAAKNARFVLSRDLKEEVIVARLLEVCQPDRLRASAAS